jgi:FkbM family methyltransferase
MLSALKTWVRRHVRPNLHSPDLHESYRIYGSDYGGWPLLDGTVSENDIVYSFGVGEDISFDKAVIEQFGCHVYAFDPTPRATYWISRQTLPVQFEFHPIGIADTDGEADFFPPANPEYASFSNAPGGKQWSAPIRARVMRLQSIMEMLGHERISVLKMDIEGFEYAVIRDILDSAIRPQHLLIEFHHRMYQSTERDTRAAVDVIRFAGYSLFYVSKIGREYGFYRSIEAP